MKKPQLLMVGLVIGLVTLSIFLGVDKKKISSQKNEISDLEEKVETLEKKVSSLEDEKDDLEKKVADLTEVNNHSYQPNLSSPNYQTTSPETFYQNNGQAISGSGFAIVVYKPSSCDYFILENSSGYIVAEWMGGNDPDLGDKVSGNFNSFGTKDFFNQSRDRDCRLWIDDYMLSKESALEKVREQCN
jgi:hypothetical protein